jgi:deoxyribose-phosphate aldolase
MFSKTALAKLIDHTLLRPDATEEDIIRLCEEARECHFACLMVFPSWLQVARRHLRDSDTKLGAVVAYPFGALPPACKVFETRQCISLGAAEIDMVVNIGALRSGNLDLVKREIQDVVTQAKISGLTEDGEEVMIKIIVETGMTTREEQEKVVRIAEECRADFIKTCSGCGPRGATVEDVRFLRQVAGREMGIKAAGGIRTYEHAVALINAGANRIGTSSGVAILRGYEQSQHPLPEEAMTQRPSA